ncbi:hypothetical protein VULLAG_LOCUS584 [Vulpes lagopus]
MKRPLSPSPLGEKEPPTSGAKECFLGPQNRLRPSGERKRPSYAPCDVCNIQLNSSAQARCTVGGVLTRWLRQLSLGTPPPGQMVLRGASKGEGGECS